ncbi:MAG: hypothetical protein KBE09_00975 [Candidatus Pacebacteria bacterium]|nr:hypothetical protein [Candidatus Paceibacterota bacterium]
MKDNRTLRALYEADQSDRKHKTIDWRHVGRRDELRQNKAKILLDNGLVCTAADYFHAAMIFQHAIELSGNAMAQKLARKSIALGDERAKWLYAAATDRLLMRKNKKQKYGTQYTQRHVAGEGDTVRTIFELYPYDKTTTDKERAQYNVPSLKEARQIAKTLR